MSLDARSFRAVGSLMPKTDLWRRVWFPTVSARKSDNIALISVRTVVLFVSVAVRLRREIFAAEAANVGPLARVYPHMNIKRRLGPRCIRAKRTCVTPGAGIHRVVASARRLRILILFRFAGRIVRSLSSRV